ncbi:MAG: succinyl-diaminopimelate desuccinylase [Acidimicrobiales bacterium]|nr:succinyl-diaminopimelate desuccinylase [Acidimicrobiales bacterium]
MGRRLLSSTVVTDLLAKTAAFVDIPSVSFAEKEFVDWLERDLRAVPWLSVDRIGDNIVARTSSGRSQRIILAGHTDTVPVNNNGRARIEGDILYGVGSADMKGGLAVFHEIAHTVPEPAVDLSFVFYAREEVAQEHSGLGELIRTAPHLLEADCAILGEPTDGEIEAGCQGALRFRITLGGDRAHTARPWMGRNAIHRAGPLLVALAAYEPRRPVLDGCEFIESVQTVRVDGGQAGNVVPDHVAVTVHHRYAPDRSADVAEQWFLAYIDEFIDADDEIELIDRTHACPPSLNHPILARLAQGRPKSAKLGWTDVARFAELGIPATNFGSGDPTVAHTEHEHLRRDSIERTFAAIHALVTGTT